MVTQRAHINYLYFGIFFVILALITTGAIYNREFLGGSQLFFLLYGLGQVVLEITLFMFLGLMIHRYLGKVCFALFIGVTFLALIFHILDFIMDRILDLSIWQTIKIFILDESIENLTYLLDASGIPMWGWLLFFAILGAVPLVGIGIYHLLETFIRQKPMFLRKGFFIQSFLCIPFALLYWDHSASQIIRPDTYAAFIKSLPWKFTFLPPDNIHLSLPGPLNQPIEESLVAEAIEKDETILAKKPNIYLFVVESLREDFITQAIAPNLYAFKNQYDHFDLALSNGNGTHISWFSTFHSEFPFHWKNRQSKWAMGSPPLALLKKWGYTIHLYSSAQLAYYKMEPLLFGKELNLIDDRNTFHHESPMLAADADLQGLQKLKKDWKEHDWNEGHLFIIFWDATHFDYSWPKNWTPKFSPFAKELTYFKTFQSNATIQLIKNRYRNGVHFMDSLFGEFMNHLPNREEAIVIFMGDHGEEFFEHGHLFHNSHLSNEQTHIPLYMKLGTPLLEKKLASQMDIFPTLIDRLSGSSPSFLEGASLLRKNEHPYVVTARFNAGSAPYEFSLHNGSHKLIARFENSSRIDQSKNLKILSMRSIAEKNFSDSIQTIRPWVEEEFGFAMNRLFKRPIQDASTVERSGQNPLFPQ